jgi:inner membrane protein
VDPLTHTLVGANLASTRLGSRTRLAAAALVIGANLPDIDGITYFIDSDLALGFRRGWTHGVLALVLLPFLQTALLMLYARLRPDPARAVDGRWLLALSAIGIWSHPFLDWLNTYGMRWLMPFSGKWFYGDSVYIMDPWLWLVLGTAWMIGRRPTLWLVAIWGTFTFLIARVVAQRSPEHLWIIAVVALVLLAALLWKRKGMPVAAARRYAAAGVAVAAIYIGGRLVVHELTEERVEQQLVRKGIAPVERMMVGPHPLDPLRWTFVAQSRGFYHYGSYGWNGGAFALEPQRTEVAKDTPEYRAAKRDPSVCGFVAWTRFPAYEIERDANETRVRLFDARRMGIGGRGGNVVVLPNR